MSPVDEEAEVTNVDIGTITRGTVDGTQQPGDVRGSATAVSI
jgi:hypothetical protein